MLYHTGDATMYVEVREGSGSVARRAGRVCVDCDVKLSVGYRLWDTPLVIWERCWDCGYELTVRSLGLAE